MAGPVGNEGFITEMDIRRVMRDFPEMNNLLDDFEFTPEEVRTAQTLVVDEWNDMAPSLVNYTVDNFPFRSIYVRGTIAYLLQMAAISAERNALSYNAGGASINDTGHEGYTKLSAMLLDRVLRDMRLKKNEINYDQCWGVV